MRPEVRLPPGERLLARSAGQRLVPARSVRDGARGRLIAARTAAGPCARFTPGECCGVVARRHAAVPSSAGGVVLPRRRGESHHRGAAGVRGGDLLAALGFTDQPEFVDAIMELVPAIAALLAWREQLNPRRRLALSGST